MQGGEMYIKFWSIHLKGRRGHLEDLGVDGRRILQWKLNRLKGVDWIHLTQDRGQWPPLINTVMNLWVP
jgi:hypothetical protein